MATNQPTGEKTAFIRTQPAELSTAEVIANAKAAGLGVTGAYVRRVRSSDKQAAKSAKSTRPSKAAKRSKRAMRPARSKTASPATTAKPEATAADPNEGAAVFTQADYIRSYPELSVNELVTQAAAEGHDISANNVRVVRAKGRKAAKKRKGRKAPNVAAANPLQAKRGPGRPRKTSTAIVPAAKEPPPAPRVLSAAAYVAPVAPPAPENHFRALIGELGLMRATQLLEDERNRVAKLLRP